MKCKGLLLLALMFVFCVSNGMAQSTMTDQQVLEYGKNALAAGKSKETIAKELMLKGVSRQQAMRIKKMYEKEGTTFSNGTEWETIDRTHRTVKQNNSNEEFGLQHSTFENEDDSIDNGTENIVEEVFGRDIFRNKRLNFAPSENLATPRNYKLGPGDEVIIDIFGANQTTLRSVISPEGSINVDILGPVYLNGMSIEANNGTVVKAATGCVVGNLSCNGRRGHYVIINHNIGNYYTIYMHMSDVNVKVGQVVSRGQKIGTMGNTGEVYPVPSSYSPYSGTHLHFATSIGYPSRGGAPFNPFNLY